MVCTDCSSITIKIQNEKNENILQNLKKELENHIQLSNNQLFENQKFFENKIKKNEMKLTIDGAANLFLPYFKNMSADVCMKPLIAVRIYGIVIDNNGRSKLYTSVSTNGSSGKSVDDVCSCLYLFLNDRRNDVLLKDGILTIEMDNCARENKNFFMLGFFHFLITFNLFNLKEVNLFFNLTGHTKNSCDTIFGQRKGFFKKHNKIGSLKQLNDVLSTKNNFTGRENKVESKTINRIINFKNTLEQLYFPIENISQYHHFCITSEGVKVKKLCNDNWSENIIFFHKEKIDINLKFYLIQQKTFSEEIINVCSLYKEKFEENEVKEFFDNIINESLNTVHEFGKDLKICESNEDNEDILLLENVKNKKVKETNKSESRIFLEIQKNPNLTKRKRNEIYTIKNSETAKKKRIKKENLYKKIKK